LGSKKVVEEKKIEETIERLPVGSFTVLDFAEAFRSLHPDDWKKLVERFGLFGSKRKYTVSTYVSNRLDIYSQKPDSSLLSFTRYRDGKFRDYRRTTEEEKKVFGSPWIAVFKKKPKETERKPSKRKRS
jgi:hypothetical protein